MSQNKFAHSAGDDEEGVHICTYMYVVGGFSHLVDNSDSSSHSCCDVEVCDLRFGSHRDIFQRGRVQKWVDPLTTGQGR